MYNKQTTITKLFTHHVLGSEYQQPLIYTSSIFYFYMFLWRVKNKINNKKFNMYVRYSILSIIVSCGCRNECE